MLALYERNRSVQCVASSETVTVQYPALNILEKRLRGRKISMNVCLCQFSHGARDSLRAVPPIFQGKLFPVTRYGFGGHGEKSAK